MSINLRLPNITAPTEKGQLEQMQRFLYQMVEQLQFAFDNADSSSTDVVMPTSATKGGTDAETIKKAQDTFNSIKSLIIKSADIVKAYYEEIDSLLKLNGEYVAQSDFGAYAEKTEQKISANSDNITQYITRIETIESSVEGIRDTIKTQNSYIHYGAVGTTLDDTGLANETAPGIEIGDHQTLNDGTVTTNKKYARFTAYGLELFGDSLDHPVAYVKQDKLYIRDAEFIGKVIFGTFQLDTTKGFNLKYIGRG